MFRGYGFQIAGGSRLLRKAAQARANGAEGIHPAGGSPFPGKQR
jgi:hypothetical protein